MLLSLLLSTLLLVYENPENIYCNIAINNYESHEKVIYNLIGVCF